MSCRNVLLCRNVLFCYWEWRLNLCRENKFKQEASNLALRDDFVAAFSHPQLCLPMLGSSIVKNVLHFLPTAYVYFYVAAAEVASSQKRAETKSSCRKKGSFIFCPLLASTSTLLLQKSRAPKRGQRQRARVLSGDDNPQPQITRPLVQMHLHQILILNHIGTSVNLKLCMHAPKANTPTK